ncbi:DUF5984 family protein [Actinoplanes xinjiangensis]|uniref:Uncharacterized protein n=1 Tax=Actinoplanes xinjiangensis TaxID=512350 RepID=A0A316F497_9ACTN|nr:DUF5984 family protein [Actinoplanes xinjiangensis]PWK39542.1 hypothetical protein BC793_122114 [Actinoplanes xinjiangensis]GIF42595.1 hypothetical protein Axi01nite_69060 [Actinoplanes xinjiangensis]
MIRFRFELRALDEVEPWGDPPSLHWFGLTDGWYWIEGGGHELLRRTRCDDPRPYVDYQVVRLWEDVNLLTPSVLEPVPDDLVAFVASDEDQWKVNWLSYVGVREEGDDPNAPDHPVVAAVLWHAERSLDLGYLLNPPYLRFWRTIRGDQDEVTVDWRHEDDGRIGFTAGPAVRFSVPTAEYRDAVQTLDRQLITAMRERVEELERRGGLPGVDLDLAGLRKEQQNRAGWLRHHLDRTPDTDWAAIRQGVATLLGGSRSGR